MTCHDQWWMTLTSPLYAQSARAWGSDGAAGTALGAGAGVRPIILDILEVIPAIPPVFWVAP